MCIYILYTDIHKPMHIIENVTVLCFSYFLIFRHLKNELPVVDIKTIY